MRRNSLSHRRSLNVEPLEGRALLSSSALSYHLMTNQSTYTEGQPVHMTFTETNTSTKPVSIAIGPSNTGFDVKENGMLVWVSNPGIQPHYLRVVTLMPGQSETLSATWNGVANVGREAGSPMTGTFTVTNQQAPTQASARIVILPQSSNTAYSATAIGSLSGSSTTDTSDHFGSNALTTGHLRTHTHPLA